MKLHRVDTSLPDRVEQLLTHQTPATRDQATLNVQSRRQITDATYRCDQLPANCSDANHLVPIAVSEDHQTGTWRYPPHMETSLLVHEDSLTDGYVELSGGFHRAGFLKYYETRRNYTGTITRSPDIDVPSDFATVDVNGTQVNLQVAGDEADRKFEDRSIPLQSFEFTDTIDLADLARSQSWSSSASLSGQQQSIKLYDEAAGETHRADISDDGVVTEAVDITPYTQNSHARAAYIKLVRKDIAVGLEVELEENTTYSDYVRLRIRFVNEGSGSLANQGYRLHEKGESVFNPFLTLSFADAQVKFPAQQHADALENAISERDETSQQDRDAIEPVYTQTNGTLTESTRESNTYVLTPYGVYDYLREIPVESYRISDLMGEDSAVLERLDVLSDEEIAAIRDAEGLITLTRRVLSVVPQAFGLAEDDRLHQFQWHAIQRRLAILAQGKQNTTVLKAPTGAGKTLAFLVNAALTALWKETRVVLAFPTRLLNEDMSKRVTRFTYALRTALERDDITAGVLVGSSDPMFDSMTDPELGKPLAQYDRCPACGEDGSVVAAKPNHRVIGRCEECGHDIDYVYHPREAISYLPTFTVATPDKLFYEATVRGYESQPYGKLPFFGGTYLPCTACDAVASVMSPHPDQDTVECPECRTDIPLRDSNLQHSPIGHWVFDEVHSLHDLSGTLLSIFLELPDLLASKIQDHDYNTGDYMVTPTFETGTATIANEIELLSAVTRTNPGNIEPIPHSDEYDEYFTIDSDATRYRVLGLLPVATSNRQSVQRALIANHGALHYDDGFRSELATALDDAGRDAGISAYEFLLGYVYKKADGRALQNSIADKSGNRLPTSLSPPFLSGNTSSQEISTLFEQAQRGELPLLLANLVISLGVDIENLNNMIMLGAPRKMTEQVQTAGRTGRGNAPGHVTMHLLPSNPRDVYLYANFHRVMSDVEGYYETYPIQPTNVHAAELMLPNLVKALLAGMSYDEFVLTARRAGTALADDQTYNQLQVDLLRLLRTDDTPQSLVTKIHETIQQYLTDYKHEWSRIDDTVYLSNWFQDHADLMYSLRKGSDQHVDIDIDNPDLLGEIRRDNSTYNTNA